MISQEDGMNLLTGRLLENKIIPPKARFVTSA